MYQVFNAVRRITLLTVHRTTDTGLLGFLKVVRAETAHGALVVGRETWPYVPRRSYLAKCSVGNLVVKKFDTGF